MKRIMVIPKPADCYVFVFDDETREKIEAFALVTRLIRQGLISNRDARYAVWNCGMGFCIPFSWTSDGTDPFEIPSVWRKKA